ncbi:MAG TPA: lytic polysaccharide monooxygenase [Micromonosporaceae bacterium]|nr:lytic polysaccharide monooxygenase [Micromonosporaceae bacterium]
MSSPVPARRRSLRLLAAAAVAVVASTTLTTIVTAESASAHGNIQFPASRNQACLDRWGTNHLAPEMQSQDPMCYQAWQADPNAMWNWNGNLRDGVGGTPAAIQAGTPNGQICSNGRAQAPRYNSLDAVGNWQATNVGSSFTARIFDQASHGADFFRFYVTRQGFNPITTAPGWSDLELVATVPNTPASQWQQVTSGVQLNVPISFSGRSGRHILVSIWQASHADQVYIWCSDINVGGTNNPPPPPPPPNPNPPPPPPPNPNPPPPPPPGGCTAAYSVASTWPGGNFTANVRVTAGNAAINGWRVTLTYPSAVTVAQAWSATVTAGTTVTATNVSYNGRLSAGGSTTFGYNAQSSGSGAPTVSCSAT